MDLAVPESIVRDTRYAHFFDVKPRHCLTRVWRYLIVAVDPECDKRDFDWVNANKRGTRTPEYHFVKKWLINKRLRAAKLNDYATELGEQIMRNQIEAIYMVARYIEDKCPQGAMFNYVYGMDPYIEMEGVGKEFADTVLRPRVEEICKPVNLDVKVFTDVPGKRGPATCISIGSALMVWDCIFPKKSAIPPLTPLEWFTKQLQEQLFPRVTGRTDDYT